MKMTMTYMILDSPGIKKMVGEKFFFEKWNTFFFYNRQKIFTLINFALQFPFYHVQKK